MVRIALALTLGAWGVTALPELPARGWLLALLPVLAAGWRYPRLAPVVALAGGLALALNTAHERVAARLDPALAGADLRLEGRVVGLPQHGARRDRFRFRVVRATRAGRPVQVPPRVRLGWYGPGRPRVAAGERWHLTARLWPPRGFANPGGFDYAGWLLREGIGATGYVRTAPAALRTGRAVAPLDRARAALRARMRALTDGRPHAGILLALTVGERDDIAPAAWDTLLATGTNHLVAISGLHVGLLALAGFGLGGLAWRAAGPLRPRLPRPLCQALCALGLATGYAALAGFALPTQRALVMLVAGLGALLLRRRARPGEALAVAAAAVVLLDPLAPLAPGFWLSFGAVAAILWVAAGRVGRPRRLAGWARLQLAIALALAPLLVVLFGQASLVAPLANLLAVPWVSLGVVPPALAGAALAPWWPEAAQPVLAVADAALRPAWAVLEWLAALPFAQWQRAAPPPWAVLLGLAGVAVVLAPRGLPGRAAGALALLPLLVWAPARPPPGAVWLDVLDVGQGLAAVVRTTSHTLVYDTGPRFSARFDAGSAVVVPFLRHAGTPALDALVVSHGDGDHAGGTPAVRRAFPPRRLWAGEPRALGPGARLCRAGTSWRWDGVGFRFLHPDPDAGLLGNDASCVLRIDAPGGRILLPGDIERAAERRLLARGAALAADVVVAPHHGSATSSTPAFVARVAPQWVIYAVGHDNRWGFPDPAVMARWRPAGFARTDCAGALHLRIEPGTGVRAPRAWREQRRRLWHAGCGPAGKSGNMRAVSRRPAAAGSGG